MTFEEFTATLTLDHPPPDISAPLKALQKKFGFEPERVVSFAKEMLGRG